MTYLEMLAAVEKWLDEHAPSDAESRESGMRVLMDARLEAERAMLDNMRMSVAAPPLRVMDPDLKKLMDNLPKGDPDAGAAEPEKAPPERVEVWTAWTQGRREVPCGTLVTVHLGTWAGPRMLCTDIVFFQRNVKTGVERTFSGAPMLDCDPYITPGHILKVEHIFKP